MAICSQVLGLRFENYKMIFPVLVPLVACLRIKCLAPPLSRNFGWRQGLQIISVFCSLIFLLGTCYRSATMYHPQRRAIVHLKSQRRKLLESNILKVEKSNSVTDLKAFKTRAFHFAFAAAFFAAFAFYLPFVYLVRSSSLNLR